MKPTLSILFTALLPLGCVGPGMLTDGTSVSVGTHSRGALRGATALPFRGEGYVVPQRWMERRRNYGTDELVQLLVRTARRVNRERPGGLLGVADLSLPAGGQTPQHRSHHSGRDVDLIFYMLNGKGKPVPPTSMIHFDRKGEVVRPERDPAANASTAAKATSANESSAKSEIDPALPARLDLRRNWAMVRALLTDPQVPVQWIFIGRPLARLLLRYAKKAKESPALIRRAERVMHQPSDAQSHMDHIHVRIFCSLSDRAQGCIDRGPPRWFKRSIKYVNQPTRRSVPPELLSELALPTLRF